MDRVDRKAFAKAFGHHRAAGDVTPLEDQDLLSLFCKIGRGDQSIMSCADDDGIVLIDNDRCIGCKFCMTGCPYSTRVFAWKHYPEFDEDKEPYSPEASSPGKEGTVSKCDFCPDLIRVGKLPYCASSCPMGVIYFGDIDEDTVTNGTETYKVSELIRDRAGYRYLEILGTRPTVYYLPPVDRQFPVESGLNDLDEEVKNRYTETPYLKKKNK